MYRGLNDNEYKVFEFIKNYIYESGYAPSIKEISTALGIKSTSTVHRILGELDKKDYIQRQPAKNRAIKVVSGEAPEVDDSMVTSIPLIGVIAAGRPIMSEENVEEYIPIPNQWLGVGEYFMLRVIGDSMVDAGIFDGDLLIVQKTNSTRNGEIVVALVDGDQTTVKRYYREPDGRVRLQPENPMYDAIYADDIRILGRVKKSIRNYF